MEMEESANEILANVFSSKSTERRGMVCESCANSLALVFNGLARRVDHAESSEMAVVVCRYGFRFRFGRPAATKLVRFLSWQCSAGRVRGALAKHARCDQRSEACCLAHVVPCR
jgi:hypothetical protein